MRILITGAAGFIGSHSALHFRRQGHEVLGIDSFDDYYSVSLKEYRKSLLSRSNINIEELNLSNLKNTASLLRDFQPDLVIHLAAQAGIRLGSEKFERYTEANLTGFSNILQNSVMTGVKNFIYASSSSVYGNSNQTPYEETLSSLEPISYYGATKLANEILANGAKYYSDMNIRGLRFFTVYGPFGRPDMAYFRLFEAAENGTIFKLNGNGKLKRDFTFINDVTSILSLMSKQMEMSTNRICDVVNIGGGDTRSMIDLISTIEVVTNKKIQIDYLPSISQDVQITDASKKYLESQIGSFNFTKLESGIKATYKWFAENEIRPNIANWVKS